MIPPGLPGAGNVLVFDNDGPAGLPQFYQKTFPGSRILEIDPVAREIVWQYDASRSGMPFWAFYSSFISSARRLPNGNTLICEGMHGRFFQVTREGEIVWEFVNPRYGEWSQHQIKPGQFRRPRGELGVPRPGRCRMTGSPDNRMQSAFDTTPPCRHGWYVCPG